MLCDGKHTLNRLHTGIVQIFFQRKRSLQGSFPLLGMLHSSFKQEGMLRVFYIIQFYLELHPHS